jgi:hypothetical protein
MEQKTPLATLLLGSPYWGVVRGSRAHLRRLAETPGLVRLVPSHGPVIDRDPAGARLALGCPGPPTRP